MGNALMPDLGRTAHARPPAGESMALQVSRCVARALLVVCCWLVPGAARAATFIVNVPWDGVDFNPGDGICETAPGSGICTLRAAVMEANRAPGSTIHVTQVVRLDIPPSGTNDETTGDLNIGATMTIAGTDPATDIIDANGAVTHDRAIRIEAAIVTITGVTIRHGQADVPDSGDPAAERGGGVYVTTGSTLVLSHSVVHANTSTDRGGGLYVEGGAVSISDSTVDKNRSSHGGGIYKADGALTIERSTIGSSFLSVASNIAEQGGGLYDAGGNGSATLVVSSAVIRNGAGSGGGLYLGGAGAVTIQNVTIGFNDAQDGAGIYVDSSAPVRVISSTISGNEVRVPSGWGYSGAVSVASATPDLFTLENTILAGNRGYRLPLFPLVQGFVADCRGRIVSIGHNLLGSTDYCTVVGEVQVGDPKLGWLQGNGGPTMTYALLPGSPAIDAIEPAACRDALGAALTSDQRGFRRPVGLCDIGAFELAQPLRCVSSLGAAKVFVPVAGSSGVVSVFSPDSQCAWVAASAVNWIVVTAGYGTGNGTVSYIVLPNTGGTRAGTMIISGQTFTVVQASREASPGDFDGDRRSDLALYRPSNGVWYVRRSGAGFAGGAAYEWGLSTDVPVAGDYDGDGKIDLAVYRPSTGHWFILKSSANYTAWDTYQWAGSGDNIPVPGDYDGDGRTDIATYWRLDDMNGGWRILQSSTDSELSISSLSDFLPVQGDYDGDGRTDPALYDPSTAHWYIRFSSGNYRGYQWGSTGDVPAPADYDGDGKADLAVFRPPTGHWFILKSSTSFTTWVTYQWGAPGDIPIVKIP